MARYERPRTLPGSCTKFSIHGDNGSAEGYIIVNCEDEERKKPVEIFLKVSKEGSTLAGLVDTLAITLSHALQNGAPLGDLLKGMAGIRYEPHGFTDDPEIKTCASISDYIAKRMALDYLPVDDPYRERIMNR